MKDMFKNNQNLKIYLHLQTNMMKNTKKCRYELNGSTEQPHRRFIHIDLALKIIMDCRTDKSCNFSNKFGFTPHDVINTKE